MNIKSIIVSVCLLTVLGSALVGCGGGGEDLDISDKDAALSTACDPSSGPVGATVVCKVKGMEEGATVFFENKPVESIFNAEDDAVSFTVPAGLPGVKSVYSKSGEGENQPIGEFEVTSVTVGEGTGAVTPPSGGTPPAGDIPIVPGTGGTGTAGTGTGGTGGVTPPPPDADGDGVADATDACAGTPSGTTVDSTGCPPPPPPPTGATVTLDAKAVTISGAKVSTYNVTWSITGAKDAYLWGDFNRDASDASLAVAAQCERVGTRLLFTQSNGTDINYDPSLAEDKQNNVYKAFAAFLKGGKVCNNENTDKEDDCLSSSTTSRRNVVVPTLIGSRFNDPLVGKSVYGLQNYELVIQPKGDFTAEKVKPGFALAPGYLDVMVPEDNPLCRISLKKADGSIYTTHPTTSYGSGLTTRFLAQYGQVCIAAVGDDAKWAVKCVYKNAPSAALTMTNSSVSVNAGKPVVDLNFDYDHSLAIPTVTGCTKTGGANAPDASGHGSYLGECKINKDSIAFSVSVQGIGAKNIDKKNYTVDFGTPTATYQKGTEPLSDDDGNVSLRYSVKRPFTVKEGGKFVDDGECPWANGVEFYGLYKMGGSEVLNPSFKKISESKDAEGDMTGYKSAEKKSVSWSFKALSFDGFHNGLSNVVHSDFPTSFEIISWANGGFTYDYTYDGCGALEDCEDNDCCDPNSGCGCHHDSDDGVWDCRNFVITVVAAWSARNVKAVHYNCSGEGNNAQTKSGEIEVDPNKKGTQTGSWSLKVGGTKITCNFTATAYNDQPISSNGWWAGKGETYCDK